MSKFYYAHLFSAFDSILLVVFIHDRLNNRSAENSETSDITIWGDDTWIGRHVSKDFGEFGTFRGKVLDVDDNANKPGYRVFHVLYEDGDEEWMGAKDLQNILLVTIIKIVCVGNNMFVFFIYACGIILTYTPFVFAFVY